MLIFGSLTNTRNQRPKQKPRRHNEVGQLAREISQTFDTKCIKYCTAISNWIAILCWNSGHHEVHLLCAICSTFGTETMRGCHMMNHLFCVLLITVIHRSSLRACCPGATAQCAWVCRFAAFLTQICDKLSENMYCVCVCVCVCVLYIPFKLVCACHCIRGG